MQVTFVGAFEMPHEPPAKRSSMLPSRIVAAVFLLSSLLSAQSIDTSKVGVVHLYREGRLLVGVSLSVDGNDIVSLTPNKIATFYLFPGYHELTLRAGEISPTASFKVEPGEEYFFKVDYEHVVSATSLRDLRISLSLQPDTGDADELREVPIDFSKLMQILALSNPHGGEPAIPPTRDSNRTATE
jgi:hypothetical protein